MKQTKEETISQLAARAHTHTHTHTHTLTHTHTHTLTHVRTREYHTQIRSAHMHRFDR